MFNALLKDKLADQPFLIMTHRGLWGGNIIQNTTQSAQLAYAAGTDIVEVDICRSADGIYYLFHDGGELDLLGIDKPFWELDSKFIDQVSVLNSLGNPSGYHIQKLEEFLAWLPSGHLVNIDRSWKYWDDPAFFKLLHESGKSENLLLKSPVEDTWLSHFSKNANGLAYMPIVKDLDEISDVFKYEGLNIVAVEIVLNNLDNHFLTPTVVDALRSQGLPIMANAEKLGEHFELFAGLDDDQALFGSQPSWQAFLDLGVNLIQTDWPHFLNEFREQYDSTELNYFDRSVYEDYQGPVKPELLHPLLGQSYTQRDEFKPVVDLLNQWQMKTVMEMLDKLKEREDTKVDALRLQAEIHFVYEEHEALIENVDAILALVPSDLQALWLGTFSHYAREQASEAAVYLQPLEVNYPKAALKLKALLELIQTYSDYAKVVTDMDKVSDLDVIAVYGYGLTEEGGIPKVLEHRLEKGIELLNAFPKAKIIVSGGAVSTPYNEAEAMGDYLLQRGIEEHRIILEPLAKDTVGNSLMITEIIQEHGFNSCCVVTSITHLPRALVSLIGAAGDSIAIYGAALEHALKQLPEKERQLMYITLFRAANLYSKDDLESETRNDFNI